MTARPRQSTTTTMRRTRGMSAGGRTCGPRSTTGRRSVGSERAGGSRRARGGADRGKALPQPRYSLCSGLLLTGGIAARHCSRPAAAARGGRGWRRGGQATAARPPYIRRGPSSSSMPGVDAVRPRRRRLMILVKLQTVLLRLRDSARTRGSSDGGRRWRGARVDWRRTRRCAGDLTRLLRFGSSRVCKKRASKLEKGRVAVIDKDKAHNRSS